MNKRQRFLNACGCQPVDYPPIWLMRQAGRALPEYRELRQRYSFLQLVQTPDLAAEVSLQPLRRFDFDAAIVFSDILVVPEALGQRYQFRENGGIAMEFALRSRTDLERLNWTGAVDRARYVGQALSLLKKHLRGEAALLGFSGSPWTLANFMVEGGSSPHFQGAKEWLQADPEGFNALLEPLTRAVTGYLQMQIEAGADAVQIFDTLGNLLEDEWIEAGSWKWIRHIVAGLAGQVPVIVFSKGSRANWRPLLDNGAGVLSVDDSVRLSELRLHLPPTVAIQGNLAPSLLESEREPVAQRARQILQDMAGRPGFIFNLGHGLTPQARLDNVGMLVEIVRT